MSGWGISENASEIEKIKSQYNDFINGLNSTGELSYSNYSEAFDIGTKLIEDAYLLGKKEAEQKSDEEFKQAKG